MKNRINSLKDQKYAGTDDWRIVKFIHFKENSGEIENKILQNLKKYSKEILYKKDGRLQRARELLECDSTDAIIELNKHIANNKKGTI
jgi:hypothetical protein